MGSDYVTETPKPKETTDDTKTMGGIQEESKPKKKSLWQKFKDHHKSGEARKVEAHFADLGQMVGGEGYTGPTGSQIRSDIRQDALTAQKIEESQARIDAKTAKEADNEKFIIGEVDTVATKDDGTPNINLTDYQLDVSKRRNT